MTTNTFHPTPTFLDLTGLPDPVVQQVTKLVYEAREKADLESASLRMEDAGKVDPSPYPMFISDPRPTLEESKRLLDEMAKLSSGQSLPLDWSRADIYDDHD